MATAWACPAALTISWRFPLAREAEPSAEGNPARAFGPGGGRFSILEWPARPSWAGGASPTAGLQHHGEGVSQPNRAPESRCRRWKHGEPFGSHEGDRS